MALPAQKRELDESLQKLQEGVLTLDEYLNERVEKALAHVKGRVPEHRLQMLREVARDQVRTDPVLIELVRRATGKIPQPPGAKSSC